MAKKITIDNNEPILHSLEDDWGGVNNTQSPQTIYETEIPVGAEWGVNRGEVERFIKEQFGNSVGYFHRNSETNVLYAFRNEDDYRTWFDDPTEHDDLVITSVQLPSLSNEDSYSARIYLSETPNELQADKNVTIRVRGTLQVISPNGATEDYNDTLNVVVETSSTGVAGTWSSTVIGNVVANSNEFKAFSLASFLSAGMNYIRVRVSHSLASSPAKAFQINVVDLFLVSNNNFQNAIANTLQLSYYIGGNIGKSIQFFFGTGHGNSFRAAHNEPLSINIGTATYSSTAWSYNISNNEQQFGYPLSQGLHSVRARLYVNENIHTDWIESEYLVADGNNHVIINNIASELTNWTDAVFFDWALYSPDESLQVVFRLTDQYNNNYVTWQYDARNGVMNTLRRQLAIVDTGLSSVIITIMHIEDANGNQLADNIQFNIINDLDYAPTMGADFIVQPANRTNSETNRNKIRNEADGTLIDANFLNFGWINDGWIGVKKDIDVVDSEAISALHISAGSSVEFLYNPFSDFTWQGSGSNENASATFEIDFRVQNILNYETPILQIGDRVEGKIWGFEMLPTKAYLVTTNETTIEDQDVDWAEGIRTHLAVNIVKVNNIPYVRIFINGVIDREFNYSFDSRFTKPNDVTIKIGNNDCDIDIFGIRSYRTSLPTASVLQDYKASLSTSEEKEAFSQANDILVNGKINWQAAIAKGYNVIGYKGTLPKYGNDPTNPLNNITYGKGDGMYGEEGNKKPIELHIHIADDPDHSVILKKLEVKGQGTTAMTYYDWNQSYKVLDVTEHYDEQGNLIDGMTGKGYSIGVNEPKAKKLVGKINFASSMQSHKLGLTSMFSDIFRYLVNNGSIERPSQMENTQENIRIAVYEKPFLFFHYDEQTGDYVFKYLMTFGAGKGDKPTFGFKSSQHMTMVEGADNEPALCNFGMPWREMKPWINGQTDGINYNTDKEAWYVGTEKHINFGLGNTEKINGVDYPSDDNALASIQAFWNFVFDHNMNILPYNGTLANLNSDANARTEYLYWLVSSRVLYRFNGSTWTPALWLRNGSWVELNVETQYGVYTNSTPSWSGMTNDDINQDIINARVAHFRLHASEYFHVDDALYHSCFIKLFAGTDNRAKNTYYYTDPVDLKIRWMQDDLDTTIKTNNLGQNRKPYYVEEHDTNASGGYYWAGERNAFYNLLETAFNDDGNTLSMRNMMSRMLAAMSALGDSVMGYINAKMTYVQTYFPAVAYNQQAELVYETARLAMENGQYSNGVNPITQSCGSQRWSEYQWLKDRIMYISSWCAFGDFAGGGMNWRAAQSDGTMHYDTITYVVGKHLYPRFAHGNSIRNPNSKNGILVNPNVPTRCTPFDEVSFNISTNSDVDLHILGNHYLLGMGDLNVYTNNAAFNIAGRMLQGITINPDGNNANHMGATGFNVNAENIKNFVARNIDTVSGTLNLSSCVRLQSIDLRGTPFTIVTFPNTERLTTVVLPATITSLIVDGQPNINTISFETTTSGKNRYATITDVKIIGNTLLTTDGEEIAAWVQTFLSNCKSANAQIVSVELDNIEWGACPSELLMWLANVPTCKLKGQIVVSGSLTFAAKVALLQKFGNNIDDENGELYISYTQNYLNSFSIECDKYIGETGNVDAILIPSYAQANNMTNIAWSINNEDYATISDNGILNVHTIGNAPQDGDDTNAPQATIICTITTDEDGVEKTIVATKTVYFYQREAEIGDYVFHDGTYSNEPNALKTTIGKCFFNEEINGERLRLMVALVDLQKGAGQLNTYADDSWGCTDSGSNGTRTLTGLKFDDGAGGTTQSYYATPEATGLIDGANVTVYDTPLRNRGAISNSSTAYILNGGDGTDGTYVNADNTFKYPTPTQASYFTNFGFKVLTSRMVVNHPIDSSLNFENGTNIPVGQWETLVIINHRNYVLAHLDGRDDEVFVVPRSSSSQSEMQHLNALMDAISTKYSNASYKTLFYPAASKCFAYEPTVQIGQVLDSKFKAHKWWLPSSGELCRLAWWNYKNELNGGGYLKMTGEKDSPYVTQWYQAYHSSSEASAIYSCIMNMYSNPRLQGDDGRTNGKGRHNKIRPICRF